MHNLLTEFLIRGRKCAIIVGFLLPSGFSVLSDVPKTLAFDGIYGDGMVFQADKPIRLKGYAPPLRTVSGRIDANPRTLTTADSSGRWRMELPPLPYGGPHVVEIGSDGDVRQLKNVLIGEVWFCSGQSNMEYPVWSEHPFWRSIGGDEAVKTANLPQIRLAFTPIDAVPPGGTKTMAPVVWKVCSPETVAPFSAVGFYFGRELFRQLNVPIGLIFCAAGGTKIEPWISADSIASEGTDCAKEHLRLLRESNGKPLVAYPRSRRTLDWEQRFYAQSSLDTNWTRTEFDDSNWEQTKVPTGSPLESVIDGAVLYRRAVDLPETWQGADLQLNLGAIDDCDETFFNGVKIGGIGSERCSYWEAKRSYVVPASLWNPGKNILAVSVTDFTGNGGFVSPAAELTIAHNGETLPLAGEWKYRLGFASNPAKTGKRPDPVSNRIIDMPGALFSGSVRRWVDFPIRGVLWYQGESNATEPEEYAQLFPLLIQDWRRQWRDPDMAFIYAQLSAFIAHTPTEPLSATVWKNGPPVNERGFTLIREVQARFRTKKGNGMAVTIDVGDPSDIHPREKQTVGWRLAREAERICYRFYGVSSGPRVRSLKKNGGVCELTFDCVGGGLSVKGNAPGGFAVAGKDGIFYRAEAEMIGSDRIRLFSNAVKEPETVCYAWADFPWEANLSNREGFPMEPFNTGNLSLPIEESVKK